ncbi:acid protease [Westerdykella ornata]|uniref:Acid protease n=1 Tax=Westerdykella ornata TaxID=318751 RepID=A0A6A6JVY3_WESOR|nr:acid protease [Westerdykella ornata]KAF2280771.1 acid protease [Westerdykella ornata]
MGDVNRTVPPPFVFAPSQAFDGNDGRWSTFIVRVGTPEQNFRVLPSIQGHEIFIPLPDGCIETDPDNCGDLRGVYPFNGQKSTGFLTNASSSWKPIGLYNLYLAQELNYTGNGLYGFDTVGLMLQNSGGLTLENQVVAGIATKDFYLGLFGLGPKPSNFSDWQYPQPSFMQTLKDKNRIPSLSFAYTAGAAYRIPKLPGSLTLGGYDASRYTPSDRTFPFSADDSKVLSVGVQRITAANTLKGTVSPLDMPIFSFIDSTVPHIWLPRSACDRFEEAFGLKYDPTTDLYLVNDTIHQELQRLQPTVTFSLGNDNNPANIVTIQVPYGAFDLQASHPIYENSTNYFPIRRAANDTQYTLGRTFLQEAYVIADYERANFSVHQAVFQSPMPAQQIIPILSPSTSRNTSTPSDTTSPQNDGLSRGAIIGIGVGLGVLALVLALFLLFFLRRRKAAKKQTPAELPAPATHEAESKDQYELYTGPTELYNAKHEHRWEVEADVKQMALMSDDAAGRDQIRHELPADSKAIHELPSPEKLVARHEVDAGVEKAPLTSESTKPDKDDCSKSGMI